MNIKKDIYIYIHIIYIHTHKHTHTHTSYKRLTSALKTQTKSEGMEKSIPCKFKSKVSQGNNTYIKQRLSQKTKDIT